MNFWVMSVIYFQWLNHLLRCPTHFLEVNFIGWDFKWNASPACISVCSKASDNWSGEFISATGHLSVGKQGTVSCEHARHPLRCFRSVKNRILDRFLVMHHLPTSFFVKYDTCPVVKNTLSFVSVIGKLLSLSYCYTLYHHVLHI